MELNLISDDIKRDIPKFGTVFTQTRATYGEIRKQNSNFHKLELWTKSINDFGNFERHFPCATSAKILAAMYARVPQAMAQFVLKIEKLSHIMAPTPILEMARAYGLHPRLWLLTVLHSSCFHSRIKRKWSINFQTITFILDLTWKW